MLGPRPSKMEREVDSWARMHLPVRRTKPEEERRARILASLLRPTARGSRRS